MNLTSPQQAAIDVVYTLSERQGTVEEARLHPLLVSQIIADISTGHDSR